MDEGGRMEGGVRRRRLDGEVGRRGMEAGGWKGGDKRGRMEGEWKGRMEGEDGRGSLWTVARKVGIARKVGRYSQTRLGRISLRG